MILVDTLRWMSPPTRPWRTRERWAHMVTTSPDIGELHDFAEAIGLRREWFQDHRIPHYDIRPRQRRKALNLGAAAVSSRQLVRQAAR